MRLVRWFPPLYRDRAEGGRALADAVAALALEQPVVVGIARGGVAVAVEVARALEAPLTAVDVEPVNARGLRLGAATAAGTAYMRENQRVPTDEVQAALERARRAAEILELPFPPQPLPLYELRARAEHVTADGAPRSVEERPLFRVLAAQAPVEDVIYLRRGGAITAWRSRAVPIFDALGVLIAAAVYWTPLEAA